MFKWSQKILRWFLLVHHQICLFEMISSGFEYEITRGFQPSLVMVGSGDSDIVPENDYEKKLVLYYNFDKINSMTESRIVDSSGYENHGRLSIGGLIIQIPGSSCSNAIFLDCAEINLFGETFQAKPVYGVTLSAWINLLNIQGKHSVFEIYGSTHTQGIYHFEVDFGILRWIHRNERQEVVFAVSAEGVPAKKWVHVLGTYNSSTGIANIYINGMVVNRTLGHGLLSRDWSRVVHIGSSCSNRPLIGFVDEFKMYNYALSNDQILQLSKSCIFEQNKLQSSNQMQREMKLPSSDAEKSPTNQIRQTPLDDIEPVETYSVH